jgi:alpha-beta hydrolase superfamily lysophospholipase
LQTHANGSSWLAAMNGSVATAVARFARLPPILFAHLPLVRTAVPKEGYEPREQQHLLNHRHRHQQPHHPDVLVFSHGLGGTPDLYLTNILEFVSHGWTVLALEHKDGSGAIGYRFGLTDVDRPGQLAVRVAETTRAIEYANRVLHARTVVVMGHSFGGATAIATCAAAQPRRGALDSSSSPLEPSAPHATVDGCIALDPWMVPLGVTHGRDGRVPLLVVDCENFGRWVTNTKALEGLIDTWKKHNAPVEWRIEMSTGHQIFSDVPLAFPLLLRVARQGTWRGRIWASVSNTRHMVQGIATSVRAWADDLSLRRLRP